MKKTLAAFALLGFSRWLLALKPRNTLGAATFQHVTARPAYKFTHWGPRHGKVIMAVQNFDEIQKLYRADMLIDPPDIRMQRWET